MSTVISISSVSSPAIFPLPKLNLRHLLSLRRLKRKNGFSMIELLVVIGIIAFMALAAFVVVPMARNSWNASKEADFYAAMSADTRTVYSTQGNFNGVSPATMIKLGLVPSTLVRNNVIVSSFETNVEVAPTNLNGNANDGVEFSYTLPREVCTKFVQKSAMASARVTVGGQVVLNRPTGENTVNVSTLADACDSGAGGNVNILLAQGR